MLLSLLFACGADADLVELTVDGVGRSYYVHVPAALAPGAPVIFAFHGGGTHRDHQGRTMPRFTGFDAVADDRGFVVVYPNSLGGNWNDGRDMGTADDLAFFDAMRADVLDRTGADPDRMFSTGISNGGFFSDRLACERAEVLAGVAIVAATEAEGLACAPARPVPVMLVPGTDDPLVPYGGGGVDGGKRGFCRSADDTFADWLARNGCAEAVTETDWKDTRDDHTSVRERSGCRGRAEEVRMLTIEGGGHTWPGGRQYLPRFVVGRVSHELSATEEIADFFLDRDPP